LPSFSIPIKTLLTSSLLYHDEQTVKIKDLIGYTDTTLPSSVSDLIIENLGVSFNTKTKDFTFTCESKFPIDSKQIDITVNINITQQLDGFYKKHFDGHITIGSLKFALIFDTNQNSTNLLAAYHDEQTVKIKDLIGYTDPNLKDRNSRRTRNKPERCSICLY
jgi:hypothetical protein